jgi:hypothetical protein
MLFIAIGVISIVIVFARVEAKNVDAYKQHDEIFYDDYFDM